jgi:hypothetical protein
MSTTFTRVRLELVEVGRRRKEETRLSDVPTSSAFASHRLMTATPSVESVMTIQEAGQEEVSRVDG